MRLAAMVRRERTNQMPKKKLARAKPEAETTKETNVATESEPAPKKKGGRKKAVPETTAVAPMQIGNATLAGVAAGYLAHMEEAGKSSGTIASYGMELKTAMNELGAETPVTEITIDRVQMFFDSPRVTKLRSG